MSRFRNLWLAMIVGGIVGFLVLLVYNNDRVLTALIVGASVMVTVFVTLKLAPPARKSLDKMKERERNGR